MIDSNIQLIMQKVKAAKEKVLEMCIDAGTGHLTTAFSCAEILSVLYYGIMRQDPTNPSWHNRDRFIMSKNHGTLMQYPILADLGYFPEIELATFTKDGGRLSGHSHNIVPGIDFSGGSLGIGLGFGAGLAYAASADNEDWLSFVLLGDAECHEGSVWEAAMFAAHNRLYNLIAIVDRNELGCTDFTERILKLEPLADKWKAFGWEVFELDGHNIVQLLDLFSEIRHRKSDKPMAVIANTIKGNGIDFMSQNPLSHGQIPKGDNIEKAFAQLRGDCV